MKLQKQSEMQDFLTHWELMKIYLSKWQKHSLRIL